MLAHLDGLRRQAGFESLPPLDALWPTRDRLITTSLAEFDGARVPGWELVRHVGPVLEDEKCAVPATLPWPVEDPTPLVLMSFSTGFEQRSVEKLQRGLDALSTVPVHVIATTGGIVAPEELRVPANTVALNYAAHDPIMRRAALVVTHGGHGTAMRALRHGVPMVIIPGLAGDQPFVAAAVQEWGGGIALAGDADATAISTAAQRVLTDASYRRSAQQKAKALDGVDGAANAADAVEELLAAKVAPPRQLAG